MSPLDLLIARVTKRRDRILREMRRLDEDAEDGAFDQGGYLLLEVRLIEVRRFLAELRKCRRSLVPQNLRGGP